jgi:hypothetical protein
MGRTGWMLVTLAVPPRTPTPKAVLVNTGRLMRSTMGFSAALTI